MIVADTGAVVALVDADDRHHEKLAGLYREDPDAWVLPWAILPEVDYLLGTHLDPATERSFLADLADERWTVEWGDPRDLARARELCEKYIDLEIGLVDGVVAAIAERLSAETIATLDLRHFGVMEIDGPPRLIPRDL